ncbi:hypothetical protein B0H12DRAFT_1231781 [Mycena haematopus]|nr:hypothetical protein B0H12DRAFT_1231781 [Mycena haematopus]
MSAPTTKPLQSLYWIIALAVVQAVVCIFILQSRFWDSSACAPALLESLAPQSIAPGDSGPKLEDAVTMPLLVNEAPAALFRDNLRPDVQYLTSWPAKGWSNQVIQYMNLLYLARVTERIPIIPQFRPVHMQGNASGIDFSDVFDLARLRKDLKTPILEWRDVKELGSETVEDVGCWDLQYKTWEADSAALEPPVELNLDVSYTPIPQWVHSSLEMDKAERGMYLWPLASLVTFNKHATSLPPPTLSPLHQNAQAPDDQLFCCNSLFFDFTIQLLEARQDISPAWQGVGRHMHWAPKLQAVAANYTREALGLAPDARIPPYIAVHIRRGDFAQKCKLTGVAPHDCLAPLSAYERRVREVRAQIMEDTGVAIERVLVMSDETDPAWWASVRELGWVRPEHNETVALYGPWYPMFIDAVILGGAYGFVGTDTSTASILARRRVSSRGGVADLVKWGKPHADDH